MENGIWSKETRQYAIEDVHHSCHPPLHYRGSRRDTIQRFTSAISIPTQLQSANDDAHQTMRCSRARETGQGASGKNGLMTAQATPAGNAVGRRFVVNFCDRICRTEELSPFGGENSEDRRQPRKGFGAGRQEGRDSSSPGRHEGGRGASERESVEASERGSVRAAEFRHKRRKQGTQGTQGT